MDESRLFGGYPSYIVTSPFGMRVHPISGTRKMHNGIDLVATADGKTGQVAKIKAHTGGVVDRVGYDKDAGNFVKIQVDLDTVMVYYHLRDKSTLMAGEVVQTGDIIGTMGDTGTVTGKHLHFGIKHKGQWIDPAPYLDADYPVEPEERDATITLELPVLEQGANGKAVKAMQILLAGYGYKGEMRESAYGSFGSKTAKALRRYQQDHGLTADGSCGPATWASLLGVKRS